jgi:hypothetical protein
VNDEQITHLVAVMDEDVERGLVWLSGLDILAQASIMARVQQIENQDDYGLAIAKLAAIGYSLLLRLQHARSAPVQD